MASEPPTTHEPEFSSEEEGGVTYRIASQRVHTAAGELVVRLADGSDSRQQWVRLVLLKALLPNLMLMVLAVFAVNWAVRRALRPLLALKAAVEHRSLRDLSAIDLQTSPEEVRPLVRSLNRLFELVNTPAAAAAWHENSERAARFAPPGQTALAIADEIARVHRSELVVDSGAGGHGTRVTLQFAA